MATLKLYLDTRAISKDGRAPLKIALNHKGSTALINLDIKLEPKQWNGSEVVKHPLKQYYNSTIAEQKLRLEKKLIALSSEGYLSGLTANGIKNIIMTDTEDSCFFAEWFIRYMDSRKAARTREIYRETLKRMREYDQSLDGRKFKDIDRKWLKGFDLFMEKRSPSLNARAIHFRNIRAVFNDAIDEEVTACYPFRKFKIKHEATAKRSLSIAELREIFDRPLDIHTSRYRDYFKLMFLLIGIYTVDICNLKRLHDGRADYKRAKTGRQYSIKIEPEAAELIEKHRGKDWLLDAMDRNGKYLHFANRLNLMLHRIRPGLSAYWARHSWATIAAELDIPKETIAAALGHGGNTVTDIYINFDQKKVDEANRRVIDYVLYGKK